MISIRNVTKRYGSLLALKGIDLDIEAGQTTALIGPSGCGKSTLLRSIVGLIEDVGGQIMFDGETVSPSNLIHLRRRMGYVIQDGGLFPHLTARKNISLMADFLGRDPVAVDKRITELAELTHFPASGLDRYPAQLSGGQRQRISLMRALMLDPDVLLLDEPLGALDPMIRADLQRDLKVIFENLGKTVVLVSHDMGEAAFLGHNIVLMRDGEIVQKGSFSDLYKNPADEFVSKFISAQRSHLDEVTG